MRRFSLLSLVAPIVLLAGGCASMPVASDPHATAAEVFQLSGGLDDLKVMARFAPQLIGDGNVREKCMQRAGQNPSPLAVTACDMLDSAARGVRSGQGGLSQAFEAQIDRMESRAVEAMVETYSPGELAAMKRYYASPEGRSIVSKRREYLAKLFGAGK